MKIMIFKNKLSIATEKAKLKIKKISLKVINAFRTFYSKIPMYESL